MMSELSRLLGESEQSAPELAGAAITWLCGQWAFLVLACVALLSLVLLLCLKESFRIQSTCGTRKVENESGLLFSLAKTAYKRKNMDLLMKKLTKLNNDIVDNQQESSTGLTLLLCACLSGQKNLVEILLLKGVDLNATSTDGDTALILATYACCTVKGADPGLLDLLACRGVNVNAQNCNGDSPLSIAALHGRTELLSILLQYGADIHAANKTGCSPIDFASYCGYEDSAKLLTKQCSQA